MWISDGGLSGSTYVVNAKEFYGINMFKVRLLNTYICTVSSTLNSLSRLVICLTLVIYMFIYLFQVGILST